MFHLRAHFHQPLQGRDIKLGLGGSSRRRHQRQATLHLAPAQARRDGFAHGRLETAQGIVHPQMQLQIAMIDGAQFKKQYTRRHFLFLRGKAGHAVNQAAHC